MPARPSASRRTVLRGAAAVPAAALGLAACSAPGGSASDTPTAPVDLGAASDVSKGGAKLYRDHNVVVSREANGTLKAYSTICTHARCPINELQGTTLICSCHGSRFDAMTGKVVQAPATEPLPELPVKDENGRIVAGPSA
ncbi:FeS-binding protein [Streptomyces pluripotens]|uniref:Cytochrome bc1 complex Rieske iron-sulfur subunit n=1 Tax=Streptomyces pluripotens TaxID=1355015 RepID=A0A221NVI0_9ACTN|nr:MULTISPECIES: Rieske (2Fe-2S) protein [Streptomyces]ARP69684.1 FeS-binding protein [Streptomyces pluripotens]ASN23940.1 FeS-binding protein [Streptomyces pluripotens]KIE24189.1 FeS-binding protein [Streptomyces sp. MUSC 125]MCH0555886.1 Rieske (2Fe-2S) protein [Streptomyces sp. MUM 16J]